MPIITGRNPVFSVFGPILFSRLQNRVVGIFYPQIFIVFALHLWHIGNKGSLAKV